MTRGQDISTSKDLYSTNDYPGKIFESLGSLQLCRATTLTITGDFLDYCKNGIQPQMLIKRNLQMQSLHKAAEVAAAASASCSSNLGRLHKSSNTMNY